MSSPSNTQDAAPSVALVCRVRSRFCAVPVSEIDETMRPLPMEPMRSAPSFVSGVAIVRGVPTPVLDAGRLLGAGDDAQPTRFVVVRVGERRVALAVEAVVGLRTLSATALHDLPPLIQDARADVVAAIGALDASLLVVLRTARLVPETVWNAIRGGAG
ncbi:MAG TPA: chemotaxis protein CheW [Polyangia bacterium]|nr:chemotaxis protein CheW [Polyangia bacterium]